MAKVLFVPDWLNQLLKETGQSRDSLIDNLTSTIVSKVDVINYHKSQWQFCKLLTNRLYCDEDTYSMYQNMFVHAFPDMPEMELALKADDFSVILWDEMAAGSGTQDRVRFRTEASDDGSVIYIIGECVGQSNECETVCAEPHAIVCNILHRLHDGIRITGRGTDKTSVFRESPLLTQLYVKLNKSFC